MDDIDAQKPFIGGIDPGKGGGFVALYANTGKIAEVLHVPLLPAKKGSTKRHPDLDAMSAHWGLCMRHCRHIFIEHVWGAAPRGRSQGGAGMFNFGDIYGFVKGMIWSYDIPRTLILPMKWRKVLGMTSNKDMDQKSSDQSFALVRKLFPDRLDEFARKTKDDGVAEAALIAHAGRILLGHTDAS